MTPGPASVPESLPSSPPLPWTPTPTPGAVTGNGTRRPVQREYRSSARTMWHVVSDGE